MSLQSAQLSSQQKRTDGWQLEMQRRNQKAVNEMKTQQQNRLQLSQEVAK